MLSRIAQASSMTKLHESVGAVRQSMSHARVALDVALSRVFKASQSCQGWFAEISGWKRDGANFGCHNPISNLLQPILDVYEYRYVGSDCCLVSLLLRLSDELWTEHSWRENGSQHKRIIPPPQTFSHVEACAILGVLSRGTLLQVKPRPPARSHCMRISIDRMRIECGSDQFM